MSRALLVATNSFLLLDSKGQKLPEEGTRLLKDVIHRVSIHVNVEGLTERVLDQAGNFSALWCECNHGNNSAVCVEDGPEASAGVHVPTRLLKTDSLLKNMHDEYWHEHVDANQYPGFEYTALIYLNDQVKLHRRAWKTAEVDQGYDYTGGLFSFIDEDIAQGPGKIETISPKCGKLVYFTSGSENVHRVHKVESGLRYALTIAFTCDKSKVSASALNQSAVKKVQELSGEWDA
eukprot:753784-Hanusia_phi.AAC.9